MLIFCSEVAFFLFLNIPMFCEEMVEEEFLKKKEKFPHQAKKYLVREYLKCSGI